MPIAGGAKITVNRRRSSMVSKDLAAENAGDRELWRRKVYLGYQLYCRKVLKKILLFYMEFSGDIYIILWFLHLYFIGRTRGVNKLPKKLNYKSEVRRNIGRPLTRWEDDFREEGTGQGV